MNETPGPLPPINLNEMVKDMPGPKQLSLADINAKYRLVSCVDCGRGGHTHNTLMRVVLSIATGELGYACDDHVGKYIRPKDLKRK